MRLDAVAIDRDRIVGARASAPARRGRLRLAMVLVSLIAGGAGCGGGGVQDPGDPPDPRFDAAAFDEQSAQILFNYFPLTPGTMRVYEGPTDEGYETGLFEVTDQTRMVAGVRCRVAHDRMSIDGVLTEVTDDWYAQDRQGNVWCFGEATVSYENGVPLPGTTGWEAGVDGAVAGILIKIDPVVGDNYAQADAPGVAEERARVIAEGVNLTLRDGSVYEGCLQTLEWSPLEAGSEAFHWYAPGIGLVRESRTDGSRSVERVQP